VASTVVHHPVALVVAIALGLLVAVQARWNAGLGAALGDGVDAALLSYAIGWGLLTVVLLARPAARRALTGLPRLLSSGGLAWWTLLGGLGGALLIASQALTVPVLGVAVFTVAVVAGQTASSLGVDSSGLTPGGPLRLTWARVAGAVLATTAVVVAVAPWSASAPQVAAWAVLLAAGAGVGVALQQSVNGRVAVATAAPLAAAWVNFAVGTAALLIASWLRAEAPGAVPWDEWWLLLGGPIGALYVVVTAAIVRRLGVLLLGLALIAGQLVGAVLLDLVAPTGRDLTGATVVGVVLTLVAVAVAAAPGRRAP
jgi:transporter family-2 protein